METLGGYMPKSVKGNEFERETANQLSLWWSSGHDDAVFWRPGGSGGRATVRAKKGRKTSGRHGDIVADDPSGRPLTRVFVIELKRGYNKQTFNEIIDLNRKKPTKQPNKDSLEGWIYKLVTRECDEPYWLLIHRRDNREALAYFPAAFYDRVKVRFRRPFVVADVRIRKRTKDRGRRVGICITTLPNFLAAVSPKLIRKIAKRVRKGMV
jgi:hypothetical protein